MSQSHAACATEQTGPLYISDPITIGKHKWRMLILKNDRGQTVTRYEFSGFGWQHSREWPTYDINDTYLGLPRTLRKLFDREHAALSEFGLKTPSSQIEMF